MAETIYVGATMTARVTFRSEVGGQSTVEDPTSVTVRILDSSGHLISGATPAAPTREAVGVYSYQWTPLDVGTFTMEFDGVFGTDDHSVVPIRIFVEDPSTAPVTPATRATLGEDRILTFMVEADPMFADPEDLAIIYPDTDPVEVSELIHTFSLEAQDVTGLSEPTALMREYVFAATACALSRIYGMTDGDTYNVALGDLHVEKQFQNKSTVTRSNATTWCELAALLRQELYLGANKTGIRAIVRGSRVELPAPTRMLQRQENKDWQPDWVGGWN